MPQLTAVSLIENISVGEKNPLLMWISPSYCTPCLFMIDFALPLPRNLRKSATEGSFSAPFMTAATISIGGYQIGRAHV